MAVTEKELSLAFRFKIYPIVNSFINPIAKIIPVLLIYYGFLHFSSAGSFGGITKENYILVLSTGMFLFTIYNAGITGFSPRFGMEKYWKTIDALLISPISSIELIIGVGLADLVINTPAISLFLATGFLAVSIDFFTLLLILVVVFLVYLICLSAGLAYGSVVLSREGYTAIISYLFMGWNFLSCFVYPITIMPEDFLGFLNLKLIAFYNPVYQGLSFVNQLWSQGTFDAFAFSYVLLFAIITPFIAGYIFKRSWKKLGIEGY